MCRSSSGEEVGDYSGGCCGQKPAALASQIQPCNGGIWPGRVKGPAPALLSCLSPQHTQTDPCTGIHRQILLFQQRDVLEKILAEHSKNLAECFRDESIVAGTRANAHIKHK